jgi:hypothetical protein
VFAIAKETGWGEDYILDMPIAKAWGYRHAILRSYDVKCNYKIDDEERQEMHDLFKELSRD